MPFNKNLGTDPVTDAAVALIAVHDAGIITIPASVPTWQRDEIARELRIGAALLRTANGSDVRTVALDVLTNIRHGLARGSLVVTRDDAARHVQVTLRDVRAALDAPGRLTAAVCFDAPTAVASVA